MANTILHKRSSTSGTIPSTGSLSQGELGINIADGRIYTKNNYNNIINLGVTSISGTSITPSSGNFSNYLAVNSVPVSLSGHSHTTVQQAESLVTTVFNETGSQLSKMTAVYINGGHGDLPTVQKAIATSDATSAGTYGLTYTAINNMESGQIIVFGSLSGVNTDPAHGGIAGATEGSVLYLSPTVSGAITTTKPYAPDHVVAVGTVVRVHQNDGVIEVRVQNGFELEELHNVAVTGATNGQFLYYDGASDLWQPNSNIYSNGTNIGIGTNSPIVRLEVAGDIYGNNILSTGYLISNSLLSVNDFDGGSPGIINIGEFTSLNQLYWTIDQNGSGNFSVLSVNDTPVSLNGHTHSSSDITNFNSSVSGLLPTIANSGDNRVLTSTGSSVGINAESNLTFNGSLLNVTGSGSFASGLNVADQTASTIASFDSSRNIVSLNTTTYPSLTELSYVKGVTSSIQTQLNGKQNTLTNPVTGTGVANHIAYWNSSSGIVADSGQLYWNSNTNCLGIGTTSPLCTLDVHGYIQAGFGINGKVVITDDQYGGELGILTNNEEALAIKYNDGSFRYGESLPGASDGIIVSSNKNIGIGTESPSAKLHVIGTGLFSNSIGINTNTTSVGATPYALLVDGDVSIGSGNAGRTLSVWSNNSTKRTVIKNVNGTSFLTYSIGSQNLNIGGPQPTDSPFNTINYYAGNPTPSTASHRFHVSVDGTGIAPIAVITNSGLGIGTTSPSYTLDVSGTIGVSGIARFNNDIYMLDNTKRISWDNGTEYIGRQGDSIIIGTQSTTRILVSSTGGVGIGTESPGATLDVRGSAIFNEAGADVDFRVEGDTDANLVFVDASTDRVGIGTSTPSDKLNVVGNISAGTLSNTQGKFIAYGSASQPNLLFEGFGTDGTARISTNSGANRQLKIENDGASNTLGVYIEGDVGIGTTTPGYKLQVAGSFGATTKSFRIDHPSKKGYSLEYGSLESPYHGVRLTGRGKLVKGVGTVQLPDYLKDLIHDDESITIQLTNYKHGKTLYVSNIDLQNDQFIVKADRAKSLGELEFFWTLTGVRKDVEDLVVEKRN